MGIDFSKFSPDFKKAFEAATAETSDGGKQITENEWNSFSKKDQETLTKLLAGNANALGEGLFDQQMTLRFNRANDNKPTVYQHKDNETTQTITVKPGEKLTSGSLLEASKDTIARYPDAKWGYYSNGKVTLYDEKGRTIKDSNGETVSFDFTGEGESRSELTDWYMKHNGGKFNLETFTAMQELDDRLNNMEEYETDISQLMRDIDLSELKNASEDVKASFFERLDAKAAYKKAQAQDAMLRGAKAYQDAVQNGEWQDEVLAFLSGYGAFFQSADSALGITKFKEFVKDANLAEFVMKYTGSDAIQEKLEELADDGNDDITTKTEAALSVVRMVTDAVKAYGSLNNTADSMRRLADDGDDSNLSAAENIVENIIGQAKGLDSFIGTQGAVFVGGLAAATAGATAVTVAALGEGASSAAVGTAIGEMVTGYFALEGTSLVFDGIKDAINAKTKEQAEAAGEKMGMGEFMAVGGLKIGRSVYKAGMRKVRTAQIEELTAKYREMEPQALLEELGNNPKTNNKIAITDVLIEKGYTVIEKPVIENGKIKTTETLIYSPDGKLVKGGADVAEVTTETLEDGTVVTMRNGKKYSEVTPDGTERRFNAYGETLEFRPDKTLVVYDENGNVTKTEVWENIGGSRMSLSQAKNLWMSDHLGHQTFKDGLLTEIERFINVEPRTVTNVTGTVEIAEGKLTVTRPNGTKVDLFEGIPQEVLNAPATDFMHFPDATTVPESFGVKLTQHASSPIEAQYIPTGRTVAETLQLANESGVPLKFDTEKKAFYQDAPYGGRQYVNTESITPIYTHEAEPNWGLAENYANEYGHEVQTSDGVKTYAVDRAVVTANPKPTDNGLSANCAGKQYDIVHPDGTRTPYSPDKVQPGQTFRISKREGIELKMAVFDKPTISPEGETLPAGKLLMIDADGHPYDGNPIKRIKSGEVTFDFDMNDPRQAQIKADIDESLRLEKEAKQAGKSGNKELKNQLNAQAKELTNKAGKELTEFVKDNQGSAEPADAATQAFNDAVAKAKAEGQNSNVDLSNVTTEDHIASQAYQSEESNSTGLVSRIRRFFGGKKKADATPAQQQLYSYSIESDPNVTALRSKGIVITASQAGTNINSFDVPSNVRFTYDGVEYIVSTGRQYAFEEPELVEALLSMTEGKPTPHGLKFYKAEGTEISAFSGIHGEEIPNPWDSSKPFVKSDVDMSVLSFAQKTKIDLLGSYGVEVRYDVGEYQGHDFVTEIKFIKDALISSVKGHFEVVKGGHLDEAFDKVLDEKLNEVKQPKTDSPNKIKFGPEDAQTVDLPQSAEVKPANPVEQAVAKAKAKTEKPAT